MEEGDLSVKQTLTVSWRRGECSGSNKWRIASVCRTRSYTVRGMDTDFSEWERLIWGDGGSEIRGDFMEVAFVLTLGGRGIWNKRRVRGRRGKGGLCDGGPARVLVLLEFVLCRVNWVWVVPGLEGQAKSPLPTRKRQHRVGLG